MAPKPPASLVRYLRENRCVLFCGSGLSAWAKLPTWKKLLQDIVKQLAEETQDDPNLEELGRLIEAGKLLEIADHCKEALGHRYNEILSEQLRGATGEIPEPHKVIVQLPFSNVVTTNFDKLLERAYASVGSLPKTPTHRDIDMLGPLLFDRNFFILKAHGDIDRPDSMVLTTRDYQEIIHSNPAFNSIFSALLLTKAVLFIGYSLSDPDFRLLLDRQLTVFRGNVPLRYALMTGIGKVERDVLWRTAKIRVIGYKDGSHEEVLQFLRTLLHQVSGEAAEAEVAVAPSATIVPAPRASVMATVLRPAISSVLSIGLRGQSLESSVDCGGNAVQGVGSALDWPRITKMIPESLSNEPKARLLGQELAKLLPEAVLGALKRTPIAQTITLRLSPELDLLPWEWAFVDDNFLVLRNPLVRAPVGVSDAARGYPIVREPVRVLLIGDPNQQDGTLALPGALVEVQELATLYSEHPDIILRSLIGSHASFDNVAADLSSGGYDVVHFAGHAWFDELEPFLMLSQLVKLRASEMRSLLSSHPPAILFLNSHYTIFVPPGASGDDAMYFSGDPQKPALQGQRGFIEAASTAGVGTLIGSFCGTLDDIVAQQVGVNFHKELLRGTTVSQALHRALLTSASKGKKHDSSHLSYAMSGYAEITLPRFGEAAGA